MIEAGVFDIWGIHVYSTNTKTHLSQTLLALRLMNSGYGVITPRWKWCPLWCFVPGRFHPKFSFIISMNSLCLLFLAPNRFFLLFLSQFQTLPLFHIGNHSIEWKSWILEGFYHLWFSFHHIFDLTTKLADNLRWQASSRDDWCHYFWFTSVKSSISCLLRMFRG